MNLKLFGISISGKGIITRKAKKMSEEIEYGKPTDPKKSEMEKLAEEDQQAQEASISNEIDTHEEDINQSAGNEASVVVSGEAVSLNKDATLTSTGDLNKVEFNPNQIQNALFDSELEGGVSRTRSTGMTGIGDSVPLKGGDGSVYFPEPERDVSAIKGMYEVGGFTVQYEPKQGEGLISIQIHNYFPDLETAMASVTDNRYMMPMKQWYKVARISLGSPIICLNERQIYEYIDGKWRRT
jgi:hypothetical protein